MVIERIPAWLSRQKVFFYGFLFGMLASYAAQRLPVAVAYWKARAPVRALAREAGRYDITYDKALQTPSSAIGKPVQWLIMHPNSKLWLYHGDPNKAVTWEGEPPPMPESSGTSSFEESVVARIVRISSRGIVLRSAMVASTAPVSIPEH